MRMEPAPRAQLLKDLFAPEGNSAHISYLRLTMGASDMNERVFSYDDLRPGETDANLTHFSLGPDKADVIPVLKQILAINPAIKILASPWSAPPWMKTNGRNKDGHLKPEYYGSYAAYFVKYIEQMKAEGITLAAVTIQNEPLNPKNTPSMVMLADEEDTFIAKHLAPAFRQASITQVHDAYPNKNLYMTEQSISSGPDEPLPIAASVSGVPIGALRNWSRNVLLWNLAADPHYGAHTNDGGCTFCQGSITLDGSHSARNVAFYTVAHFSSFVPPGSVRIGSTELEQLASAAFLTPEGKIVLVASNTANFPKTFNVKYHGKWFTTTLLSESVGTYVW